MSDYNRIPKEIISRKAITDDLGGVEKFLKTHPMLKSYFEGTHKSISNRVVRDKEKQLKLLRFAIENKLGKDNIQEVKRFLQEEAVRDMNQVPKNPIKMSSILNSIIYDQGEETV